MDNTNNTKGNNVKQFLVTWVGLPELSAFFHSKELEIDDKTHEYLGNTLGTRSIYKEKSLNEGPFLFALRRSLYSKAYLLWGFNISKDEKEKLEKAITNYGKQYNKSFECIIEPVEFDDAERDAGDYESTVSNTKKILDKYIEEFKKYFLHFSVASGTPAEKMALILWKITNFPSAKLYDIKRDNNELKDWYAIKLPVDYNELAKTIGRTAEMTVSESDWTKDIKTKEMLDALHVAEKAAQLDAPVLLLGSNGVGKELFAQYIHEHSPRKGKSFQSVNCSVLYGDMGRSELFGYIRGAFTGADKPHAGLLEHGNGGTLFLDEIGDCPPEIQAMLLRALQPNKGESRSTHHFKQLGAENETMSDVRIIAATEKNIEQDDSGFRKALFNRIGTFVIRVPDLGDRDPEDIWKIAQSLLQSEKKGNQFSRFKDKEFSPEVKDFLVSKPWPGNVRELGNAILYAMAMSEDNIVTIKDFPPNAGEEEKPSPPAPRQPMPQMAESVINGRPSEVIFYEDFNLDVYLEKETVKYIRAAAKKTGGNMKRAAGLLFGKSSSRSRLENIVKKYEEKDNEKEEQDKYHLSSLFVHRQPKSPNDKIGTKNA